MSRAPNQSGHFPCRGKRQKRPWPGMILAWIMLIAILPQSAHSQGNVDLVLVLALDVSSSVDGHEFDTQRAGLVRAFRHASVMNAIRRGRHKRIAVIAVQWAGYEQQQIMVPWTVIEHEPEALNFSRKLAEMPRAYPDGATHLSGIIHYSAKLALKAPYLALRRVIDISGDGVDNITGPPHDARDTAIQNGITINGLAIANETPDLVEYYRANVIGGRSAFVLAARDYKTYPRAILRKLVREIETRLIY
jgi:Protein of unknown function (DUF1194)